MTKVPLRDENKGRAHAEAGPREPRDPRNQAGGEYKLGASPCEGFLRPLLVPLRNSNFGVPSSGRVVLLASDSCGITRSCQFVHEAFWVSDPVLGLTLDPAARATWGSRGPRLLPFLRYIPWMLTLNRTAMPGAAYPKLSNRRARQLVFTWEAAALVSRPFLSLLIREKRREATGGHAYDDHTPGARSPGPAPLVEGRWCVSWGCHNKETLRGRETTSHEATKHSCQDIIRKWPRLASL